MESLIALGVLATIVYYIMIGYVLFDQYNSKTEFRTDLIPFWGLIRFIKIGIDTTIAKYKALKD